MLRKLEQMLAGHNQNSEFQVKINPVIPQYGVCSHFSTILDTFIILSLCFNVEIGIWRCFPTKRNFPSNAICFWNTKATFIFKAICTIRAFCYLLFSFYCIFPTGSLTWVSEGISSQLFPCEWDLDPASYTSNPF